MSLSEQIEQEYIAAYKNKDSVKLSVLRLLKTAAKNRLVDLRRPGGSLDDQEILEVILKEAKQRKDSIEQYLLAKRKDLADKEATELLILESYLPKALSDEELKELVAESIAALDAQGPKDMGRVMQHIMSSHKGQVDGKALSQMVSASLKK